MSRDNGTIRSLYITSFEIKFIIFLEVIFHINLLSSLLWVKITAIEVVRFSNSIWLTIIDASRNLLDLGDFVSKIEGRLSSFD